jgi:hypothetical protein
LVIVAALAFQMPLLAKSSMAAANAIRSLGMSPPEFACYAILSKTPSHDQRFPVEHPIKPQCFA